MRRALLALCSLFVLTTAGVCDSGSTTEAGSIVGSYTLVSVNGQNLPAQFDQMTITAGSATVSANNTFTFSETVEGLGPNVITGTWSQSGSTYTFHPTSEQDSEDGTATLSGSTLTITTTDQVIVMSKN
jgi:hypothetical protein